MIKDFNIERRGPDLSIWYNLDHNALVANLLYTWYQLQNGSAAEDAAVAIEAEHQTAQGQGAEISNPNPSQVGLQ